MKRTEVQQCKKSLAWVSFSVFYFCILFLVTFIFSFAWHQYRIICTASLFGVFAPLFWYLHSFFSDFLYCLSIFNFGDVFSCDICPTVSDPVSNRDAYIHTDTLLICCSFIRSFIHSFTQLFIDRLSYLYTYFSVKLHLRDERTNGRPDRETSHCRLSVRPFVCLCFLCRSGASILWGDEPRCFTEI